MTMRTHSSGPNYLTLIDTVLSLLDEAEVPDRDAAWAVDVLLAYCAATAVEHGSPGSDARQAEDFSALAVEIAAVSRGGTHPHVARLGPELLSGLGEDRFTWGLDVLINGVLSNPRPDTDKE
jgi:hypothetical protein